MTTTGDRRGGELGGIGKWLQGDAVAEGLKLFDRSCFGGVRSVRGVVVGAGVAVEVTVGEQVPGGDDHGVFDGDDGAHGSAAGGDAFVFGGEVGVLRAGRRECGDAEDTFEVAVTRPVLLDLTRPADSLDPGDNPAQDARCPAEGNTLISPPVSAMNTSATMRENPEC